MKIFREKQFINRWWLLMFILALIVIFVGTAYYSTRDAEEGTAVLASAISLAIVIPITLALLYLRLETRIDNEGISTSFEPLTFTRKHFSWTEIRECYVREYNPVGEYGGWGLRGFGRSWKAYNIYGNKGIQIITAKGREFLIGTQRPQAAQEIIDKYKSKTTNEN